MVLSILPLAIVKILQSSWLGGHQIHFHESKLIEFVGFLGISYVTFKSVQLIMEIRDGSIKEIKVGKLIQFISFFPTISSGPIDRYKRYVKDDKKVPSGAEYRELVIKAIHMLILYNLTCMDLLICGYICTLIAYIYSLILLDTVYSQLQ